jgi:hypothetical protein
LEIRYILITINLDIVYSIAKVILY